MELEKMHPETDPIERKIVLQIIGDALNTGYDISVAAALQAELDSSEFIVEKCNSMEDIFFAMFHDSSDELKFYQGDTCIGWVMLTYGNHQNVISDYSDNEATDKLLTRPLSINGYCC